MHRSLLSIEREVVATPFVTAFMLFALLAPQFIFPALNLRAYSQAQAQPKHPAKPAPAWYQKARAQEKANTIRLAQGERRAQKQRNRPGHVAGSKPGRIKESPELYAPESATSSLELKLTAPPTESQIMLAGQDCGALTPFGTADEVENDAVLERENVRGDERFKRRVRLRAMNLDFGKAIARWNKKDFKGAVKMFHSYAEQYPDSPWLPETMMHIADEAMFSSRYSEAMAIYDKVLKGTSRTRARNNGNALAFKYAQRSYELHQKALHKLAASQIMTGQFDDAQENVESILHEDPHWRRRTWAAYWLQKLHTFQDNPRELHTCGGNALGIVLAQLGKTEEAAQADALRPPRPEGFTLAEMAQVTRKAGVSMRGFHTVSAELANLKTPFLIHIDNVKQEAGSDVSHTAGTAMVCPMPAKAPASTTKSFANAAANEVKACCAGHMAQPTLQKQAVNKQAEKPGANGHGHFFVVLKVNSANQSVDVINPRDGSRSSFTFAQLQKEWSGYGLARDGGIKDTPAVKSALPGNRIAWLSEAQMKQVVGGCYVVGLQTELGADNNNITVCPSCNNAASSMGSFSKGGSPASIGEPAISVNQVSVNTFITDTPLAYETPIGPDVQITMSYNSQDATSTGNALGNKWMLNYGTYLSGLPNESITIYMPDGRQDVYTPAGGTLFSPPASGQDVFVGEVGNYNKLVYTGSYQASETPHHWLNPGDPGYPDDPPTGGGYPVHEYTRIGGSFYLESPTGEKLIYGIPGGSGSQRPVLLEQVDRWGNELTFNYTVSGTFVNLTSVTDAQGKVTTLYYDNDGHITGAKDPFGRVAKFEYDVNGNMVEVVDVEGHAFQYTYDGSANVTSMTSAQGTWTFDREIFPGSGHPDFGKHIVRTTDPAGNESAIYYDGTDHIGKYINTDERGNSTVSLVGTVIDGKGKITKTTYPNGDVVSTTYNPSTALPATVTNERGLITRLSYNDKGRVTGVADPLNRVTTFYYGLNGVDVSSWKDAAGNTHDATTYNAYHQPTQIKDLYNKYTYFTYTAWGAVATATNHDGEIAVYTYDNTTKRLTGIAHKEDINASPQTLAAFTYDDIGRVRTVTDVNNVTLTYDYNNLGAVTRVTYPDSTYSSVEYVCCGMPGLVTDRAGRKSYYDYDPLKRVTRMQDALGQSVEYRYDAAGNLSELLDAKGKSTKWLYDDMNRVSRKVYADGTGQEYSYAQGLLTAVKTPRGSVIRYYYDYVNNLTRINYPSANTADVTFTYDVLDQVTTMADGLGTTSYSYNDLGILTAVDGPYANDTITYSYDDQWRRTAMQINGGSQTSYSYDALGRMDALTSPAGTWTYDYVGNSGLLQQITNPNGTKSEYSYDALERLTEVANKTSADANLSTFAYGFDDVLDPQRDVRTSLEKTIGANPMQRVDYGYDGVDQLTSEVLSQGGTPLQSKSFAYDAMGNRTATSSVTSSDTVSSTYTANRLNQITAHNSSWGGGTNTLASALQYDLSGNLTKWTSTGTGSATSTHTEYIYDDIDRLTAVIKKNPTTLANQNKTEFVYDGYSRLRISKEYTWNGAAWILTANSEKHRIYDGMDVVQERDENNVVLATYTRDGNIGGILSKRDDNGDDYFFHYDGSGNVIGLTDENESNVAEYAYDAYGNLLSSSGAQASNNAYRYSTKEHFGSIGLYNYGYRFYSPGLGRWIIRDPIEEESGINLYVMVNNNPINIVDWRGLTGYWGQVVGVVKGYGVAAWNALKNSLKDDSGRMLGVGGNGFNKGFDYNRFMFGSSGSSECTPADNRDWLSDPQKFGEVFGSGLIIIGSIAAGRATGGNKVAPNPKNLYRYGEGPETVGQLASDAARAKTNPEFGHGVSTMSRPPSNGPYRKAPYDEIIQHFNVRQTGKNPNHYTIDLPEPVTPAIADLFNRIFGGG